MPGRVYRRRGRVGCRLRPPFRDAIVESRRARGRARGDVAVESLSARARERAARAAVQHLGAAAAGGRERRRAAAAGPEPLRDRLGAARTCSSASRSCCERADGARSAGRARRRYPRGGRARARRPTPARGDGVAAVRAPAAAARRRRVGSRSIRTSPSTSFVEGKSNQLAKAAAHPGRRQPGQGLQPAVHLRRRRARQDASDARGRPTRSRSAIPTRASPTCTASASSATW